MWFLLLSTGAVLVGAFGVPATRRLPLVPPPEAVVATYFLLATLVRLVVRDLRLAAFERKAKKLARRTTDQKGPTALGELGAGVGRGALQAVGGDLLGAGLALATALVRGAASSLSAPPPPQRERRRAGTWERAKALTCVASVGLVCTVVAWEPLLRGRWQRAAAAATVAAGLKAPAGQAGARPAVKATATANPTSIPAPDQAATPIATTPATTPAPAPATTTATAPATTTATTTATATATAIPTPAAPTTLPSISTSTEAGASTQPAPTTATLLP